MRTALVRISAFIRGALRALPVETVAVLAAMVSLILAIEDIDGIEEVWLARVTFAAPLVAALGFALTLLARAGRIRRGPQLAAGAVMAVAVQVAVWCGLTRSNLPDAFVWSYSAAFIAAILMPFIVVAAAAPRAERFDVFARFVRRFFEQTTLWALLCAAALAAVGVVFASLAGLFDVRIRELLPQCELVVVAVVAISWLYRLLPDAATSQVPELWRRLITAVGAPFVAVMLGILATYQAWALIGGEMPRNMMSPLVVGAGAVGFLCTLIVVAILRQPTAEGLQPADRHPWARDLSVQIARAFPLALLALLPLAFWALAIRIEEHGITPNRAMRAYALGALAILALWGSARYLRRRAPLGWEIPSVLAAVALIACYGPLSMVSLSLRSQTARLDHMLTADHVRRVVGDSGEVINLPADRYQDLYAQLDLVDDLGDDALAEVLTGDVARCHHATYACIEGLGVRSADAPPHPDVPYENAVVTPDQPFSVEGTLFEHITVPSYSSFTRGDITLSLSGTDLHLQRAGRPVVVVPLEALATTSLGHTPLSNQPVVFTTDPVAGQLLIDELHVARDGSGLRIESLSAIWLRPR